MIGAMESDCERPNIAFPDICMYLISHPSLYTGEAMKAYKSLDAYKYFTSGKVRDVYVCRQVNTKAGGSKHVYVIRSKDIVQHLEDFNTFMTTKDAEPITQLVTAHQCQLPGTRDILLDQNDHFQLTPATRMSLAVDVFSDDIVKLCYVCYVFSEIVEKEWRRRTSLARHSHGCTKCKSVVCTPRLAVSGCVHRTLRKSSTACLRAPKPVGFRTEAVLTTHGTPTFAHVFARRQHAEARTAGCDRRFTYMNSTEWRNMPKLILQTWHYSRNAEKLINVEGIAPIKMRRYHRPGAPMAGLMTYVRMDGEWLMVGWIPEKVKHPVEKMCGGQPESLRVLLEHAYTKQGFYVNNVELSV
ncbi:hypothetical protein Bbelb_133420 [Branchiostoma belcheri]|nr:hypothetical protein Bbelb_133420 [Branchiostoma belcheri]